MVINLADCNAFIQVVGDVSVLPYRGETLEFRLTTETCDVARSLRASKASTVT